MTRRNEHTTTSAYPARGPRPPPPLGRWLLLLPHLVLLVLPLLFALPLAAAAAELYRNKKLREKRAFGRGKPAYLGVVAVWDIHVITNCKGEVIYDVPNFFLGNNLTIGVGEKGVLKECWMVKLISTQTSPLSREMRIVVFSFRETEAKFKLKLVIHHSCSETSRYY
jgi:hypothetical protein